MTTNNAAEQQLQLMQARIDLPSLNTWMGERGLEDTGHALHCLLTETLGATAPSHFRLMTRRHHDAATLYGYCRHDADELRRRHQAFASPAQDHAMPAAGIQTKVMPTEWPEGTDIAFELRCRPLRQHHTKELDAYRWLKEKQPDADVSRVDAYVGWLEDQFERRGTAVLKHASLEQYQQSQTWTSPNHATPFLPETVMRGVITITDGKNFTKTVATGLGRHRAYGFGMLLIKPAIGDHGIPRGDFQGRGARKREPQPDIG